MEFFFVMPDHGISQWVIALVFPFFDPDRWLFVWSYLTLKNYVEIEISWDPPLEPACTSSADFKD